MKYFRLAIIFIAMLTVSFLLHLLVYQNNFSYANISDVIFVVSIIVFLPAVVAMTGAYQIFHGFRYVFKIFISPSFKQQYPNFREYKEERQTEIKTTFFKELLIASFILVITAMILARVAMS